MDTIKRAPCLTGIPWQAVIRFLSTAILALAVLSCAGHLEWWEGWAYTGMTLFILVLSRGRSS